MPEINEWPAPEKSGAPEVIDSYNKSEDELEESLATRRKIIEELVDRHSILLGELKSQASDAPESEELYKLRQEMKSSVTELSAITGDTPDKIWKDFTGRGFPIPFDLFRF